MANIDPTKAAGDKLYGMRLPETVTPEQAAQLGRLVAALGVEIVPIEPDSETHAAVGQLVAAKVAARQAFGEATPSGHLPAFTALQGTIDKLNTTHYRHFPGIYNNPMPHITDEELSTYIAQGYDSITHLEGRTSPTEHYTMRVMRRTTLHEGPVITAEVDFYNSLNLARRQTYEVSTVGGSQTMQFYEEKGVGPWKRRELQEAPEHATRPMRPEDVDRLDGLITSSLDVLEHWSEGNPHWAIDMRPPAGTR